MNTTTENAQHRSQLIAEMHVASARIPIRGDAVRQTSARGASRTFICLAVAALHVAAGLALVQKSTGLSARAVRREPMMLQLFEPETHDASAAVDLLPELVQLELTAPILPELLDESGATLRTLVPPRIDPTAQLDLTPFTARARLPRGQIATVLILLGIAVDGTVEDAQIVRSTGDESANAAALDYARGTRWIPGNVSGEPRPMKASLTIILGESA